MKYYIEAFKRFAEFKGRSNRPQYWYFVLFNFIISIAILIFELSVGLTSTTEGSGPIRAIYSFATFIPSLAVAVRRMHDIGKSGWYVLIPIYNIILLATAGEEGENQYGPDPNQSEHSEALDDFV